MSITRIIVYDVLNDNNPITEDDGKKLYAEIKKEFDSNNKVIVDFSKIISLTTAVVNNSISAFVSDIGIKELSNRLSITGITDENVKNTINLSLSLAESIYSSKQNKMISQD